MIDFLIVFINKIKKLIGKTNDTGGSATTGTVMGKLNNIISNNASVNIGTTTDTGATETTGTVMGKLNGLIAKNDALIKDILSDNSIVSACTNYNSISVTTVAVYETEILNIAGKGVIEHLYLNTTILENTATMKVYIDDELILNFSSSGNKTKQINFGALASSTNAKITDLTLFGNPSDTTALTKSTPNLLYFTKNIRVVLSVTRTGSYTTATVKYGLVG